MWKELWTVRLLQQCNYYWYNCWTLVMDQWIQSQEKFFPARTSTTLLHPLLPLGALSRDWITASLDGLLHLFLPFFSVSSHSLDFSICGASSHVKYDASMVHRYLSIYFVLTFLLWLVLFNMLHTLQSWVNFVGLPSTWMGLIFNFLVHNNCSDGSRLLPLEYVILFQSCTIFTKWTIHVWLNGHKISESK